ncbi:hypothetical protein HPP92_004026 [Vanilla planifolia]|uniref:U-box domain-containing protein n=1 Tax=Vanilla planifolia TaxID=51239 RepID=A0A835S2X1_VANPL|nr:hypothetical protein HPP92_004026 [Vanilla planifolia]
MADVIDSGHSKPPPADTRLSTEHVSDLSLLGLSASVLVTWFPFLPAASGGGTSGFSSAGSRSSWSSSRKYRIPAAWCRSSSRAWPCFIACWFHELDREISTLLEVIPLDEFHIAADVRELVELLSGNHICPNSGEIRDSAASVPNRALRSLISQWCASKGVPYDDIKTTLGGDNVMSMAAVEANRATARIIMGNLSKGDVQSKAAAAALLMLAKIRNATC